MKHLYDIFILELDFDLHLSFFVFFSSIPILEPVFPSNTSSLRSFVPCTHVLPPNRRGNLSDVLHPLSSTIAT